MSIYIANWKNINSKAATLSFINKFDYRNLSAKVIICPPHTLLHMFDSYDKADLGAQKCDTQKEITTGAITPAMLTEFNVKYTIVGHRDLFSNDSQIARSIRCLMEYNIVPIVCFGESVTTQQPASSQIKTACTRFISLYGCKNIIIAYEPAWAIGSDAHASISDISDVFSVMKQYFQERYGSAINMKMVYGGSVNEKNASSILSACDGLLIGRASANPIEFSRIIDLKS